MVDSPPAIAVDGLQVTRGGRPVLRDLSFAVAPGSVTGLLGPSGSGKTTLMRCILGIQTVVAGTVTVLGQPAGSPPLRSQVGYATQAVSVYDDLTVAENVRYFASTLGTTAADVDRVIAAVEIADLVSRLTSRLSGGQRSRVSLAVAMLGQPRLLVLDEPTTGLDPLLREQLWSLFHRLAADGATLLISSHVMEEAERCDRLLLMRDGMLLADETPSQLKRRTGTETMDAAFLSLVSTR
jgi:ABC-2 type transport system ATP-binding protein